MRSPTWPPTWPVATDWGATSLMRLMDRGLSDDNVAALTGRMFRVLRESGAPAEGPAMRRAAALYRKGPGERLACEAPDVHFRRVAWTMGDQTQSTQPAYEPGATEVCRDAAQQALRRYGLSGKVNLRD